MSPALHVLVERAYAQVVLAAAKNTLGDWIVGTIALLLVVAVIVWMVLRVARMLRRLRTPDVAARPVETGAAPSNIVPPHERSVRDPGVASSTSTVASTQAVAAGRPPPWRRPVSFPVWLLIPLAWLGVAFVIFTPLGLDWWRYGAALFVAVLIGVRVRACHRATVLYRGDRGSVVWVRWVKRSREPDPEKPPFVVEPINRA